MALFSHNGRSIPYQIEFAAFSKDVLLLQSSRFNADFWRPVIEDLTGGKRMTQGPGRLVTCDWSDGKTALDMRADDVGALVRTLLLERAYVVACGDAVDLINKIAPQNHFQQTLFYPQAVPQTGFLLSAIRDLLGI